jgi:hypothetical protein
VLHLKNVRNVIIAAALGGLASLASATTIVNSVGDKDGFGIGVLPNQGFDFSLVTGPAEAGGTDIWMYGNHSWTHTYSLIGLGPITSASLEIMTGGQGLGGLSSLYVDGHYVGTLTDGDDTGPAYNYARLDVFNLTPFASYLNGADTITVATYQPGDGWVLDYSQLTISDGGASAPDGGFTMLLLGLGLSSLGVARRFGWRA